MCTHLHRMGHIIESSPGNIASQLRNPPGGQSHSAFVTSEATSSDHWQDSARSPWSGQTGSAPAPALEWGLEPRGSEPQRDGSANAYWGSEPQRNGSANAYWGSEPLQYSGTYAAAGDDYYSDNGTDTGTISSVDDHDYELPLPTLQRPMRLALTYFGHIRS